MEYIILKDICIDIKDGNWIESKDQSKEGIRLIQTGNIGNRKYIDKENKAKFISEETFQKLKCTEIFEGDVLISRLPSPVGRACLFPKIGQRAITAVDCTIVKFNKKICIPEYFLYYTASDMYMRQIEKSLVGTTRLRISRKKLENIKIYLPNIGIQEKAVNVLDKVQSLIEKRKAQIEALDELVKSRFIDMFGDPFINPKGWNIKSYEDICNCITDGEHSTPRRCEYGIYLLSARNVLNHSLQLNDVDFIDEEEYERIAKRIVPEENDILISCSGSVGRACKVPKDIKFQMVRSVAILKLKENINATFVEWLIDSNYTQQQILQSINQSSQANLFQGKIKKLKSIVPPIELQNQFADFVNHVDKLKFEMEKSLKELEDNFNSLMQKAFKGELFN